MQDDATIETQRRAKKLFMPRNHSRVTQTSKDMLCSWRANCDIQILVYDSDPDNPDVKEISRVTDYVVGYTCKGGTTLQEERETNKSLVMKMQETTGDSHDLKALAKKIMNKASSRRLISKQEACVMLANMPLTSCSEFINGVPITRNHKILPASEKQTRQKTFLNLYEKRPMVLSHMNMFDYFIHDRKKRHLPFAIPHFTGMSSTPTFPVSESYARHTLIVFKPWRIYPTSSDWLGDFDRFINSKSVPRAARMSYDRVVQRHYNGTKFVDPVGKASHVDNTNLDPEDEAAILLAGMHGNKADEDSLFARIERGIDYNWNAKPKKRDLTSDTPPSEWLEQQINLKRAQLLDAPHIPMKSNETEYKIEDLFPDQRWIAHRVLSKLQEWSVCTDFASFRPLRATINGQAGTGKSVLINTLVSVIRKFTMDNDSVVVAAPTGTAAFNVNGETVHSASAQSVDDSAVMTKNQRQRLLTKYKNTLCIVIDERSLMTSKLMGNTEQVISSVAYEGCAINNKSWGGIPVVLVAGDDYQLAGMGEGAHDCIEPYARYNPDKKVLRGRQLFKEFAQTVYKLPTVRRVNEKNQADRDTLERLRIGENVTDEDTKKLQSLHIDEIERKHGKAAVDAIRRKAIHLFFTNEKRTNHNLNALADLNSTENPTAILKPKSESAKHGKGNRAHFKNNLNTASLVCRGCNVCIYQRNFFPLWGLHNGACGIADEMIFKDNDNPNNGDLPDHVVVDFPLYTGPAWDRNNPTHVPLPMVSFQCKYKCCVRTFCPLELCFARTIHKFQGLGAGPPEPNKPNQMYECVVCDCDVKSVEATHTGLFYTATSRGTTLGDEDGLNSAVYYDGPHLTTERIQTLTRCLNSTKEYLKVTKRRHWVNYLNKNTEKNKDPDKEECAKATFAFFNNPNNRIDIHKRRLQYANKITL